MKLDKRYAVGTRAYGQVGPRDWRVVCATCGAGGTVRHETRESAGRVATRDSGKPCAACGAQ
jgi:hypothetical protein